MSRSEEAEIKRRREAEVLAFLRERASDEKDRFEAARNRSVTTTAARERLFYEQLDEALSRIFKNKVTAPKYVSKKKKAKTSRILNSVWSDIHFGSMLDPREVPLRYGPVEEARRMAALVVQVAEYKRQYRDETELFVHLLGDIIQGQLHDPRDGAPLAEQVSAAIHILTQALLFLASQFKKVTVRCTPGNHGRNTMRHKERATNQKWDSIETIIYFALKKALDHVPNVEVLIPYRPFFTYEAFGKHAFMTHGDTVINPGYPGKAINVQNVRNQVNEINASRKYPDVLAADKYSLFAVGHVHVGTITALPNGAVFMTNGCLIPPDAFASSIGIFDTTCGQWLWESVPDHILGDVRFAQVDEYTDKDASLDKVIKPFTGF